MAASAFVVLAAGLLLQWQPVADVRERAADVMLRLARSFPPEAPTGYPDPLVVSIDSRSLRAFDGEWPRARLADAIRQLDESGAKVIALDLDLSKAGDEASDRELARAIAQSGRVVLSTRAYLDGGSERASPPHPKFARGAAGVGVVMHRPDPDGIVRRAWRTLVLAGTPGPTLSESALDAALGPQSDGRSTEPFRIDFRRTSPDVPWISAHDVAEGRFDPRDVSGRIVFVGETAEELHDRWDTPLGPDRAGVWIHAMALRSRIADRAGVSALRAAPRGAELGALALLSLLGAGLGALRLRWRLSGLMLLGAAVPSACLALLTLRGLLVDPVLPLAVVAAHFGPGLERMRRGVGRRLRSRDLSFSSLFPSAGQLRPDARGAELDASLLLLADIAGASALALLRTNENGELEHGALSWRRQGDEPVGDVAEATLVLADRSVRMFDNRIPGRRGVEGAAIYTPLFAGNRPAGVLVAEQEVPRALDEMQLRTLTAVGTQLAITLDYLGSMQALRHTMRASMAALAAAIDERDGYTGSHCRRLALFAGAMAERLGLPRHEVDAIELGALLHDIGKIGVHDQLLQKDGLLTQDERNAVEEHPDIGDRIIAGVEGISVTTIGCVRHHHERWNGTGYPDGLAGEAIPLGARIVALVDVWDALSSPRPYKRAYPQARVREILLKESGERFEPALVALFFEVLDEEGEDMLELIAATEGAFPDF
ncbi:MAG: CHASE2 domain-containing protein [Deltaproteobacteria bacterium]|nr:CHASE2 domain-containing protein [Deltaproteobacteria bacterium]MBW2416665.1 CHASE2 domain-containing protein [Deltaproteobacteria bacterium]